MNKCIKNACSAFAIGCTVCVGLETTTFTYGKPGSKTTKKVSKPDTKLKRYYDSLVNIQRTVNPNVGNVLTFMLLNG